MTDTEYTRIISSVFTQSVIFLAQHNRNGTVGFVLNRPSPYRVGGITTLTEFAPNPVYFGGDCGEGTLQFVHGFDETVIPGARKVRSRVLSC